MATKAKRKKVVEVVEQRDRNYNVGSSVLTVYAEDGDSELGARLGGINGGSIHDRRGEKEKALVFISSAFNPLTAQDLRDVADSIDFLSKRK